MGYKFLEIGINDGPPSYVEIVLGDHRGHELSLFLETWKGLYEQRWDIYKMLQNEYKDNFISVRPLTSVCMLNNATSRFFVRTHYDDRNDAATYVCVWRVYRYNVQTISSTCRYR